MARITKQAQKLLSGDSKIKLYKGGPKNMTYKDLKRRAIALGMPFPDAVNADFNRLIGYVSHSQNQPNPSLIDQYDDWVDNQLEQAGYTADDPLRNYQLRLGYLGEKEGKIVRKRSLPGIKKPKKPKKERTEDGLWKGTKKAYVFELTQKGFSLERVLRRAMKKYPDINDKSVKQWYRKASKLAPKPSNQESE